MKMMAQNKEPTVTDRFLNEFWTMIDISDSISRVETYVLGAPGGGGALLLSFMMLIAAAGSAYMAYAFDFKSTADGMAALTAFIIPELPESKVEITQWLGIILTLIPTVIEIFAAGLARQQIRIVQLFVVGFTLFDLVTDIPKAMAWTNTLHLQFEQIGLFSGVVHLLFFLFWLFLSTIGFELATIIFAWAAVGLFFKALGYERISRLKSTFVPNKQNKNNVSSQPINIQEVLAASSANKAKE